MILDTAYRLGFVSHAFDCLIVDIDPNYRDIGGQGFGIDCKTVILVSNLDLARIEIFDWLVAAAMAEFQFESLPAKCLAQNLVAQTNPENRQATFNQIANALHGIAKRGGITGAVGGEDPRWLVLPRFGSRR